MSVEGGTMSAGIGGPASISVAPAVGPSMGGFPMPTIDTGIKIMTNPFKAGFGEPLSIASSIVENAANLVPEVGGFPVPRMETGIKVMTNPLTTFSPPKAEPGESASAVKPPSVPEIITEAVYSQRSSAYWFADVEEKVVKKAEVIMPQAYPLVVARDREEINHKESKPLRAPMPRWSPQLVSYPSVSSRLELLIQPIVNTETRPAAGASAASFVPEVLPQAALQEQEIAEAVATESVGEKEGELEEEEAIREKRIYLEDKQAVAQRKYELKQAIKKAVKEAARSGLKKISGWLIAKFMPAEHEGNRSQLVKKKGPDGSYEETVEALATAGEFVTEEQALKSGEAVLAEKKPVKLDQAGVAVKGEDVARVYKYRMVKPVFSYVKFVKRFVKKRKTSGEVSVSYSTTNPPANQESTVEDLGLGELFPKAA